LQYFCNKIYIGGTKMYKNNKKVTLAIIYILSIIWIIMAVIGYVKNNSGFFLLQIVLALINSIIQTIYYKNNML